MQNDTTAQQGGEREAETAEAREAEARTAEADETPPEPDKLAAAQPATEDVDEATEDEDHDQAVTDRADEAAEDEAAEAEAEPADTATAADAGAASVVAADLNAARAEAESHLDDLRRLQADFDNYRKRTLREQTARAASASQALVAKLLPVLDNFELAVSAAEQSRDFDRMLKGVEMVFGELREVLQGEGLVKIEAEGKPFDPERHEAVVAVEQEDTEPGTVVDIVRTGYELRGKVLRPAMVKVAK
ncbi:MAG TPA: nucleotide exchange factor GrpE [Actinomycetes bacterium]|nr:nucleotide exchange factor GrpE [Actinomycetes bacterium]